MAGWRSMRSRAGTKSLQFVCLFQDSQIGYDTRAARRCAWHFDCHEYYRVIVFGRLPLQRLWLSWSLGGATRMADATPKSKAAWLAALIQRRSRRGWWAYAIWLLVYLPTAMMFAG